MTDWLESTDFPSGPGGISADNYSVWTHPNTQVVYFWDQSKNSWKTLNSTGAQMYTGTVDPGITSVMKDGDMWWDHRLAELRVFHKPQALTSEQYVPGYWVSSTNPEMSAEDTQRNLIIGNIEVSGTRSPQEGEEVPFKVIRTSGSTDDSLLDYEWRSAPSEIKLYADTDLEEIVRIEFSAPFSSTTGVTFPEGTYQTDGDFQVPYNITCKISAKPEFEDQFVKTSATSPALACRPVLADGTALESIKINSGVSSISEDIIYTFEDGSETVVNEDGTYKVDWTFLNPNFFIIPTGDLVGDTNIHFSNKSKLDSVANDEIGTYKVDYGPVDDGVSQGEVNGYLIQLGKFGTITDNLTIYVWNDADEVVGTLIITP